MMVTEIWPDNLEAFNLFVAMQTQWRIGMNGATGIDYSALPTVMDLYPVPQERRRALFEDIRLMEREALKVMAEQRVKH